MINLLYCGNLKMFDGIMLSLMSAANKSSKPFKAYIMTMDLRQIDERYTAFGQEHINILDTVVKRYNPLNSVVLLDSTNAFLERMQDSKNIANEYTPYAILRLFATRFELPEKMLYVDADTMFNGDLSEIENYNIDEYELAGASDHLGKRFIAKDYINSGVLYLNMKKIKETKLFENALDLCLKKKMIFPDQDAINELIQYKLVLPSKFNEQHKLKKETIVLHFTKSIRFFPFFKVFNVKQWQINSVHKILKIHAFDEVFEKFLEYRNELGAGVLNPFVNDKPMTFFKQIKYSFKELSAFLSQNGGIFRKRKKTENQV